MEFLIDLLLGVITSSFITYLITIWSDEASRVNRSINILISLFTTISLLVTFYSSLPSGSSSKSNGPGGPYPNIKSSADTNYYGDKKEMVLFGEDNALAGTSGRANTKDSLLAKIIFNVPENMTVGVDCLASLYVTKSADDSIFKNELRGLKTDFFKKVERMQFTDLVSIKLIDPTKVNFDINPLTDEKKLVDKRLVTGWIWNVKPLRPGKNDLFIVVKNLYHLNDDIGDSNLKPDFKRKITVQSQRRTLSDRLNNIFSELSEFFKDHWGWIFGVPLGQILLKGWQKFQKWRDDKKNKNPPKKIGF